MEAVTLFLPGVVAKAETPAEWIKLGARVHGGFGSFIPLGLRIGEVAMTALGAQPRGVTVVYYDGAKAPCACIADGIALATVASVGQRTLQVAPERAPAGDLARVVVTNKASGRAVTFVVPDAAMARLADMNRTLDERGRYDAVAAAPDLFVEAPREAEASVARRERRRYTPHALPSAQDLSAPWRSNARFPS